MNKYDKILSELLSKFYTDLNTDESIRQIVKEVINAEMSKLDKGNPWGIRQEILSIIGTVAELKSSKKNK